MRLALLSLGLLVFAACGSPAPAPGPAPEPSGWQVTDDGWSLQLEGWIAELDPALGLTARLPDGQGISLSAPVRQATDLPQSVLAFGALHLGFSDGLGLRFTPDGDQLRVSLSQMNPGSVRWPVTGVDADSAWILPISEGLYLPAADPFWLEQLAQGWCLDAWGELSMPAVGWRTGAGRVISLLLDSTLNSRFCLVADAGRLAGRAEHRARERDGLPSQVELTFSVSDSGGSVLEPASRHRDRAVAAGRLRTLNQKAAELPAVGRLFGATHAYLYGAGRTPEFLDRLAALGLDRMWLGYDEEFPVSSEFLAKADGMGLLAGPYDTHDNIQDPTEADTPTSDYGSELYRTGSIKDASGQPRRGFAGRGWQLSSEALRPTGLFEARVARYRSAGAVTSYFLDCDAFGELYDDYDPKHPMTPLVDQRNRLARMGHLSGPAGLVTGSESAAGWSVDSLHFTHGPHTLHSPQLWPLMNDKSNFGGWAPWRRPAIFFRTAAITEAQATGLFSPRYRIPLYQAAFHQALVSTARWEFSPTKFEDLVQVRLLTLLLYVVPPIWPLDPQMLDEHGERIARVHRVFSPLHRAVRATPMSRFEWLTPDRLVQRTRFGDVVELTANFRTETAFGELPPLCLSIHRFDTGGESVFCPAPPGGSHLEGSP